MIITVTDLFRMEKHVLLEAGRIRRSAEHDLSDASGTVEMKLYARGRLAVAADLEAVAKLLCGVQADWEALRPVLLKGYEALQLPEPPAAPSEDDAA